MSTYNLADVVLQVDGVEVTGAADGDKMVVSPAGEDWTQEVGADGAVLQKYQNNQSGMVTINLQYGAPLNAILTEIMLEDRQTGLRTFSLSVDDIRGGLLCQGLRCRIQGRPEMTLGRDPGTVTWTILCEVLDIRPGSQAS